MSLTLEADDGDLVAKAIAWGELSLGAILAHLANHHAEELDRIATQLADLATRNRGVADALDLLAAAHAKAEAANRPEVEA
ncbi:hypothetical protein [Albimonas pacifica]|uniref:Uncharacterized protein n=1 Tax=Albimonas pacifica TaxID=1114924 RepID=A0A1I3JID8_9RHOB|nr:hypothetical protein [Albimonas pacifica]SFI59926.1 hypothetical protein SAMN05216258_10818 [Albimonas pacifica]